MLMKYFTFIFFPTESPQASMNFPYWDSEFPLEILSLYLDLLKFSAEKNKFTYTSCAKTTYTLPKI